MLLLSVFVYYLFLVLPSLTDAFPQVLPTLDPGMSRIAGKFIIDCRRPTAAYFPDPEDCRNFYHCSDWTGLQKKSCGNSLYFNPQTEVCDWPHNVIAFRPECPAIEDLEPAEKAPRAFQSIGDIKDAAALKFVPLSTNPVRFPDPTPSEPLSQFTLEHGIPGSGFTSVREEVRSINGARGRQPLVVSQPPVVPIQVTPLPPLNEIDELHAPKPKGFKSSKPSRQPVPNPATINTVQGDFVLTTPFPPVRHIIPQQQPTRLNRPFNLHHPFQTNFDNILLQPHHIPQNTQSEQRPIQRITTPSPPPPPQITSTAATTTIKVPDVTTSQPKIKTTSSNEESRRQRIRTRNRTRKTTTSSPQTISQTTKTATEEEEKPRSAAPNIRNQHRFRIVPNRVRRPNNKKSRRPQIISTESPNQEQIFDEYEQEEVNTVVDRRPVPLPKGRATIRPTQRVVENKEVSQGVSNFRLKQRQRVKGDTAFLICSEGKCTRPKPGDNRFVANDLKTSASARLPESTFNRLFEQMLVNSGIDSEDDEQKGQVLSLLEAAKVQFEEDPETEQFVLDELLETTANPIDETTVNVEEESSTNIVEKPRRRPLFRPSFRSKLNKFRASNKASKQENLEEELKIEEELEEAAESIIEESEIVDQQMLLEMIEIKENIKRIKAQIEALKNVNKKVQPIVLDEVTEVSVQTATSVSVDEENDQNTSTEGEIKTTAEEILSTPNSVDDTTIQSTEETIDSTTTEATQELISADAHQNSETTLPSLIPEDKTSSTSGLKVFNAVPVTTLSPNPEDEKEEVAGIVVDSFLQDFEPLFDDESLEASGFEDENLFIVHPVQINDNENNPLTTVKAEVPVEVTTAKQVDLSVVDDNTFGSGSAPLIITESSKQSTTLKEENDVVSTTISSPVASEFTSSRSIETTTPSSFDLLVNLMDHFNLNAIITSLSEDTLDKQIKVTKSDDNSEEALQESLVIPSEPDVRQTTTEKVQTTAENVKTTTESVGVDQDIKAQPTGSSIVIPSVKEPSFPHFQPKDPEEMVHIVMPAGWSTTLANDKISTSEEDSSSTTITPTTQQVNENENKPITTIAPGIVDATTQLKDASFIMEDGFVIATNKPLVRFPTKKATVVEKKIRLQNLRAITTTTTVVETTIPALPEKEMPEENQVTTQASNIKLIDITALPITTVSSSTVVKNKDTTTNGPTLEIATEVISSELEDEQDTMVATTLKSIEIEEVPRSSSGRKVTPIVINDIVDDEEPEAKPVVIVVSSGSEIEVESTTPKEESATTSSLRPTPSHKIRKANRFSSNRDRIRKRLRLKIGGKGALDALSFVRIRQEQQEKKAAKNSFLTKGKSDKNEEEKKIDVKKLQSRRKELFRKRVRVTRPSRVFSSTKSPPTSTTTRSDSQRTTSRFNLQDLGSRSRGRSKPQAARGLFVNRRPSPLPKKLEGTNPTSGISSSTTSIQQLQRQLQEQQELLQSFQETPVQKDEVGVKKIFLKRKELPKDNKRRKEEKEEENNNSNIRCRFFKNSC